MDPSPFEKGEGGGFVRKLSVKSLLAPPSAGLRTCFFKRGNPVRYGPVSIVRRWT